MTVTPITSLQDFHTIINNGKVIVIDFWATWCGPCRIISPVLDKLSQEVGGVEFYKVDVDQQQDISEEVGIKAMPTFIVFKNGQKIDELVGAHKDSLVMLVSKAQSS
jgi:thioredoxin 1